MALSGRVPGAVRLLATGELAARSAELLNILQSCTLCPHACGCDRLQGERGWCRVGRCAPVASAVVHHGEEPCLSGRRGAGNVFFGSCNLGCVYCQNHQISQQPEQLPTWEQTAGQLAQTYLQLQQQGCQVLGWVTPSHVAAQAVEGLVGAVRQGLTLPLVYNSNAYDALPTLQLLDGIVDLYLPDLKYADNAQAKRYSNVENYWEHATAALVEMWRQVGPLQLDDNDVAVRGMLLRHLVLPGDVAGSLRCLAWVAGTLGTDVPLSLLAQYYPAHRVTAFPVLSRAVRYDEYQQVVEGAVDLGFEHIYAQDHAAAPRHYRPDFDREQPFENAD